MLLAQDFAERFDGFSIGSNDLTQPTLGGGNAPVTIPPLRPSSSESGSTRSPWSRTASRPSSTWQRLRTTRTGRAEWPPPGTVRPMRMPAGRVTVAAA
ncbi:putative PEP-binding protein [Streptomyces sp. NPDC059525]|uniref:putative PEP-binding protein n=1 Tax=Streptomyces sp. NPDC059525 TaxID=3346857 RepID=UPI003690A247